MLKKKNLANILFYIFWTIIIVGKGWGLTSQDKIYIYITYAAIIFAFLKLLITKWTKKELLIAVFLNILGILIWYFSTDAAALLLTITITSLKNIKIKKVLVYSFYIRTILFVTKISLALLGYIDKQLFMRYDNGSISKIRYALGYGQPNATHAMLFMVFALAISVYKEKIKSVHYIIMFTINIWLYSFTNSRAGFLSTIFLLLLSWGLSRKWNLYIKKIILYFSDKCFIIGTIFSVIICVIIPKLTFLLSTSFNTLYGRIFTAVNVVNSHGIPIFGYPDIITDWGYIDVLYENGIFFFLFFILSMTKLLKIFKNNNDVYLIAILICISVYLFSESYFASVLVNNFIIYFGILLYKHNETSKIRIEEKYEKQ